MKFLLLLIFVIIAAAAGYLVEPSMRLELTGKSADMVKPRAAVQAEAGGEIPFEVNPVVSTTPPADVWPASDPVVSPIPEVVAVDPPYVSDPVVPEVTEVPSVVRPQVPAQVPAQVSDVVSVMKASIASRQISKFTADQVLEWQPGASAETIDGEIYQIGNVTYQAETPFGTKNLQAKALIKDGKVVRWISPKSGMQIE